MLKNVDANSNLGSTLLCYTSDDELVLKKRIYICHISSYFGKRKMYFVVYGVSWMCLQLIGNITTHYNMQLGSWDVATTIASFFWKFFYKVLRAWCRSMTQPFYQIHFYYSITSSSSSSSSEKIGILFFLFNIMSLVTKYQKASNTKKIICDQTLQRLVCLFTTSLLTQKSKPINIIARVTQNQASTTNYFAFSNKRIILMSSHLQNQHKGCTF